MDALKKITCIDPDGYRGFDGARELTLTEGSTVEVSDEKHAQLTEDCPKRFNLDGKPHKVTAKPDDEA